MEKTFKLWLTVAFILICVFSFAQQSRYRAWVYDQHGNLLMEGSLGELNDSSISIYQNYQQVDFQISIVEKVSVRRKGRVAIGFVIGAAIGGTAAGIIGYNAETKKIANSNSLGQGIANTLAAPVNTGAYILGGIVVGGGIGMLIGSTKITIDLYRSQKAYESEKQRLVQYTFL